MKFFNYLNGLLKKNTSSAAITQDANLPLKINFKTTVTFDANPFLSAITQGALLNVNINNLKMLRVQAISSLKIAGMEDKKFHRFYFNSDNDEKRIFLQTLSAADNPAAIEEILFCSSITELVETEEDITFFTGADDNSLGAQTYTFSRTDLVVFLPEAELNKRLSPACDKVEYIRSEAAQMKFMPALTGSETRIFDAHGTRGESVEILNFIPHTRSLQGISEESFIVAFWLTTSKDAKTIASSEQLPLAEYIFAIKLEPNNIKVI